MAAFLNKNSFCSIHRLPPFLHQNQPSRESIFCDRVSDWWTKRVLTVLNLLSKLDKIHYAVNSCEWATAPKTCTLATASASGCRACHSHAASCKRRSNLPSTGGFQPVENVWTNIRQVTFWNISMFCHRQMGQYFRFYRTFIQVLRTWMGSLFQF